MLNERQERLCTQSRWDFSDLSALFLNCTLKRSPELSHTEGLIRISRTILEKNGVGVESLRPVDYAIAPGVYPDMREHGWERDDWPEILDKVLAADLLHMARLIKDAGGIPAHGNQRSAWDAGCRFDHPNPLYR